MTQYRDEAKKLNNSLFHTSFHKEDDRLMLIEAVLSMVAEMAKTDERVRLLEELNKLIEENVDPKILSKLMDEIL